MRDKFSPEHNMSKIKALYPIRIGKIEAISMEPNCANLVIKSNKIVYKLWHNCSSYGFIILSIIGNFLSTAQKHNR